MLTQNAALIALVNAFTAAGVSQSQAIGLAMVSMGIKPGVSIHSVVD
jgi:hypothetical protein